jgi:hypothetical protein
MSAQAPCPDTRSNRESPSGGPGGKHDGTYVQDWQFTGGSTGTLDKCNGGQLNGKFVYFVTDSYPYFPHCAWGKVSRDFARP